MFPIYCDWLELRLLLFPQLWCSANSGLKLELAGGTQRFA